MIITRTPYRISFLGGGTDYSSWYAIHGGAVLAATITRYSYLTCRYLPPFHEHKIRVAYSRVESCKTLDEIRHPAVREGLRFLNVDRGVEIHHDGDLPGRSGIGSSSAFTVGLLHALHGLRGQSCSKHQLAQESIHLEQKILKETVGSQDQVLAAYGGLNHISFPPDGDFCVRPITISRERLAELNAHLMLFYTGIKRTASEVAASYANDLDRKKRQMRTLMNLVEEGVSLLTSGQDLRRFGDLLHEAWQMKRDLSPRVSTPEIDELYEEALAAGATGGKLAGAGGGGFVLLIVPPSTRKQVKERLHKLVHVPIELEFQGSQVIFYEPQLQQDADPEDAQEQVVCSREDAHLATHPGD